MIEAFRADVERTEAAHLRFITMRTVEARTLLDMLEQTSRAQRTTIELTRYDPVISGDSAYMEAWKDGDYVRFDDVQELLAAPVAADTEQETIDELSDEEKAALDRLDKPEWRAASNLKLRAILAVEVENCIRMGAKIENLQDALRAASGGWVGVWEAAPVQGEGVLATDGTTVIAARWFATGWAKHDHFSEEVEYLPEGWVTHWKPFYADVEAIFASLAAPVAADTSAEGATEQASYAALSADWNKLLDALGCDDTDSAMAAIEMMKTATPADAGAGPATNAQLTDEYADLAAMTRPCDKCNGLGIARPSTSGAPVTASEEKPAFDAWFSEAALNAQLTNERIWKIWTSAPAKSGDTVQSMLVDFARIIEREVLARLSTPGAPVTASDLHSAILSIPSEVGRTVFANWTRAEQTAYTAGHRDARLAAAEMVVKFSPAPVTAEPEATTLQIGVSVDDDGATVVILQPLAEGKAGVIYTAMHPKGDSTGSATIFPATPAPADRDAICADALEEAAQVCYDKYFARAAQGFPREASTARALRDEIIALKSMERAADAAETRDAKGGENV